MPTVNKSTQAGKPWCFKISATLAQPTLKIIDSKKQEKIKEMKQEKKKLYFWED